MALLWARWANQDWSKSALTLSSQDRCQVSKRLWERNSRRATWRERKDRIAWQWIYLFQLLKSLRRCLLHDLWDHRCLVARLKSRESSKHQSPWKNFNRLSMVTKWTLLALGNRKICHRHTKGTKHSFKMTATCSTLKAAEPTSEHRSIHWFKHQQRIQYSD